jgi:hypothetical protein
MPQMIMHHLEHELDLGPEQSQLILPIVEDMDRKFQDVRKENKPKMEAIVDEASQKASLVLDPRQKEKLLELENKLKAHFAREPGADREPPE